MYDSIDNDLIEAAAAKAAELLSEHDFAEVGLMPGDATFYRFIILPPCRNVTVNGDDRGAPNPARDYLVVLATSFGLSYEWGGQKMHADYCAEKWASDHRPWTGEVVARFLTALSAHVITSAEFRNLGAESV